MLVNLGHYMTKVFDTDKEEVFILARGFRGFSLMFWEGMEQSTPSWGR